jgi:hypothetical protein
MSLVTELGSISEITEGEKTSLEKKDFTFDEVQQQSQQTQEQFASHPLVIESTEALEPTNNLEVLGKEYEADLKEISPYPETIKEIQMKEWEKQLPAEVKEARQEFNNQRDVLIEEWEQAHGKDWPRYDEDIYSNNGILIREKNDLYDAHHIQPLEFGGQNNVENITPLHAEDHYDRQGIHSPASVYQEIRDSFQ